MGVLLVQMPSTPLPELPQTRSDPELVSAFLSGERTARDRLLAAWSPVVLGWCMRLGGPGVVAADVAQDVLVTVLTRGHTVREPARFPAWVYGVTKKTLLKHRAFGWVRRRAADEPTEVRDPARDPHSHAHHAETGRRVERVLERMSASDREILLLCDLEGRSATEVADLLGIPQGTVKSRLRMARERFLREARRLGLHAPMVEGMHSGGHT